MSLTVSERASSIAFLDHVREWPHPGLRIKNLKTKESLNEFIQVQMITARVMAQLGQLPDPKMAPQLTVEMFWTNEVEATDNNPHTAHVYDGVTYNEACDFVEKELLPLPLRFYTPEAFSLMLKMIHSRMIHRDHTTFKGSIDQPGLLRSELKELPNGVHVNRVIDA